MSGLYKIDPDGLGEYEVFCDQKLQEEVGQFFKEDRTAL